MCLHHALQHNVTLLLGRIKARQPAELDARADINAVAEWGGMAGGQVQCPRRATPTLEKAVADGQVRCSWRSAPAPEEGRSGRELCVTRENERRGWGTSVAGTDGSEWCGLGSAASGRTDT
jgi:hypothetical protein